MESKQVRPVFIFKVELMKKCKKCGTNFNESKGLINYCSLQCRNSRSWSDEDKLKKSIAAKNSKKIKELAKKNSLRYKNFNKKQTKKIVNKVFKERESKRKIDVLNTDFANLKYEKLRERIIYEQNGKCNKCGNSEWMNEKIPLELEHKDGNNKNNKRENLEMLCPNCHAQTKTWRGRNKNSKLRNKISDKQLLECLVENDWNMRKSLLNLGLAAKGGNYNRCHRLKKEFYDLVGVVGLEPTMEDLDTSSD